MPRLSVVVRSDAVAIASPGLRLPKRAVEPRLGHVLVQQHQFWCRCLDAEAVESVTDLVCRRQQRESQDATT